MQFEERQVEMGGESEEEVEWISLLCWSRLASKEHTTTRGERTFQMQPMVLDVSTKADPL